MSSYFTRTAEGRVAGPFSSLELRQRARAGLIGDLDLVRREGERLWVRANKVGGLRDILRDIALEGRAASAEPPPLPKLSAPIAAETAEDRWNSVISPSEDLPPDEPLVRFGARIDEDARAEESDRASRNADRAQDDASQFEPDFLDADAAPPSVDAANLEDTGVDLDSLAIAPAPSPAPLDEVAEPAEVAEIELLQVDLTEADLVEVDLVEVDLVEADLVEADLVEVELIEADLMEQPRTPRDPLDSTASAPESTAPPPSVASTHHGIAASTDIDLFESPPAAADLPDEPWPEPQAPPPPPPARRPASPDPLLEGSGLLSLDEPDLPPAPPPPPATPRRGPMTPPPPPPPRRR